MPDEPLLSICIPTYNRPEKVRRLLKTLLPQLTSACEVVIVDNCSDVMAAIAVEDLLVDFKICSVRIIRNAVNIGLSANILRCFEMAQGDWIWIIGDDDLPYSDAITSLLDESRIHPGATFINFQSTFFDLAGITRQKSVITNGLKEFIAAVDNFSNFIFLSAGLYRRKHMLPHLRQAYAYCDTFAPHMALIMIHLLKEGGISIFSPRRIVPWEANKADHWNFSVVNIKIHRLMDLIPSETLRERWFIATKSHTPPSRRTFPSLFKYVVSEKGKIGSVRDELEISSYLGTMLPSERPRFVITWLIAYAAHFMWLPLYSVWALIPANHKLSLNQYGKDSDLVTRFLNDTRV